MNAAFAVAWYEISVLLRDARTAIVSLLGALLLGAFWSTANLLPSLLPADDAEIVLPVAGWNLLPPDLASFLRARGIQPVKAGERLQSEVAAAARGYGLLVARRGNDVVHAQFISNASHGYGTFTNAASEKVRFAMQEYAARSLRNEIAQRGGMAGEIILLDVQVAVIAREDASSAAAPLHPIYLILFIGLVWASNAGALSIAAEHAGQTLESVLMTSARQAEILVGKSLSVFCGSLIAVAASLAGLWIFGGIQSLITDTPPPQRLWTYLAAAGACAPALYGCSLIIIVACYRKTTYQSALTRAGILGLLLFLVCSIALLFAPAAWYHYALPLYGSMWLATGILSAATPTLAAIASSLAGVLILSAAALLAFREIVPTRETLLYSR